MKRILVICFILMTLPTKLWAVDLDLTLSQDKMDNKGGVTLTLNKNVKLFYEETRRSAGARTKVLHGVTFSFSFDIKKGSK